MSGRFLNLPGLSLLALFTLAASLLAKTNADANAASGSPLVSLTRSSHGELLPSLDLSSQATEPICFRCGGDYYGGYTWGYANWGYGYPYWGWYYPYQWGYWPSYYSWWGWGWPYYYGWHYPVSYYWWQYPWWSYPYSTYYWWYSQSVAPPVPPLERPKIRVAGTPDSLFSDGLTAYWDRDYVRASELFLAAVLGNSRDARYWYYKALAERALGKTDDAEESARRGAALQVLQTPDSSQLGLALERVQGPDRRFLRAALTPDLTRDRAEAIASQPVKRVAAMVRAK